MRVSAGVCRNVEIKHKHTASGRSVGGMCRGWDTRETSHPFQAQVIKKLALVFNQLCVQEYEHRAPSAPRLCVKTGTLKRSRFTLM